MNEDYKKYKKGIQDILINFHSHPLMPSYPLRFLYINLEDLLFYWTALSKSLAKLEAKRSTIIKPLPDNDQIGFDNTGISDDIRRNLENSLEKLYYCREKIYTLLPSLFSNPKINRRNIKNFSDPCLQDIYKKLTGKSSKIPVMIKIRNAFKATETPWVFYIKEGRIYREKIYRGFPYHLKERLSLLTIADNIEKSIADFIKILNLLWKHIDNGHSPMLSPRKDVKRKPLFAAIKVKKGKSGLKIVLGPVVDKR